MWREPIEPPANLGAQELRQWQYLNERFAPFALTDRFAESQSKTPPAVVDSSWWSLYATAIMYLERSDYSVVRPPPKKPIVSEIDPRLVDAFWSARLAKSARFRAFLDRWRLARAFGLDRRRSSSDRAVQSDDDECVLWFHLFANFEDVKEYALRWASNPYFTSPSLRSHRLVISRGIDLICSELLANGSEHSGGGQFFILSKLCSVASASQALKFHRRTDGLTPTEKAVYEHAARNDCPILQLVVGDTGPGFGGNTLLRKKYENTHSSPYGESDLIRFALRPDVSTKDANQLMEAWKHVLESATLEMYTPVVHGLSEVRVFVDEHRGQWTIHSNDAAVHVDGVAGSVTQKTVRSISGCVHYIQVPLIRSSGSTRSPLPQTAHAARFRHLAPLDIADSLYPTRADATGLPALADRVWAFCRKIQSQPEGSALVVNLLALDDAPESPSAHEQARACALVADTIHRVRTTVGLYLIASDATRSLLRRFKSTEEYLLNQGLLVYLALLTGAEPINVDCGDVLRAIEPLLVEALDPWTDESSVLRSDHLQVWDQLEDVCVHNSGVLAIRSIGDDSVLEGRLKIDTSNDVPRALLLGTRSFAGLADRLAASQGFLHRDDRRPYMFRGSGRTTHVYLGRLLADHAIRSDVVAWFATAIREASYKSKVRPDDVVVVALLHPAIGFGQELIRTCLPNAELIELNALGEMSIDSWQLSNVVGRAIVCIVDMVVTGRTLAQLVDNITYAGGNVIGALAILSLSKAQSPVRLFSFSYCTGDELEARAELRNGKTSNTVRIIDANSQFTERINGLNPLDERVTSLLRTGGLVCAHTVFGHNHHLYSLLIRSLVDRGGIDAILADLRLKVTDWLDGSRYVILYPGESTISYLLKSDERLFPPARCFALVPAFRGYGTRRLMFEQVYSRLDAAKIDKVLFVDDSFSSGVTERLAMDAWRSKTGGKSEPAWMTYVVVRRAAPSGRTTNERPVRSRGGRRGVDGRSVSAQFCSLGLRAFSPGDCPLCAGFERIKAAQRRVEPVHGGASAMLLELKRRFRAAPLEGHSPPALLEADESDRFLQLAGSPIWESAYNIATRTRSQIGPAVAFFCSLFASDLKAFLSDDQISGCLGDFAATVEGDETLGALSALSSLAVLPVDVAHRAVGPVVRSMVAKGSYAAAIAAAAIVLSQTDVLLNQLNASGLDDANIGNRWQRLCELITTSVGASEQSTAAAHAVTLQINALGSRSGTPNVVRLAKTLTALFYDGAHNTLLVPQLKRLTPENVERVSRELLNASIRLEEFVVLVGAFDPDDIVEARKRIASASADTDCAVVKAESQRVLSAWKACKSKYFHPVRDIRLDALAGVDEVLESVAHCAGAHRWFAVSPLPKEVAGWYVLGPTSDKMRDHFKNLFGNTIQHAPVNLKDERLVLALETDLEPIGQISWAADRGARELVITYAQRIPFTVPYFKARGFVMHTNELLSTFGATVVPQRVSNNSSVDALGSFTPVYQTRMPIVLESVS